MDVSVTLVMYCFRRADGNLDWWWMRGISRDRLFPGWGFGYGSLHEGGHFGRSGSEWFYHMWWSHVMLFDSWPRRKGHFPRQIDDALFSKILLTVATCMPFQSMVYIWAFSFLSDRHSGSRNHPLRLCMPISAEVSMELCSAVQSYSLALLKTCHCPSSFSATMGKGFLEKEGRETGRTGDLTTPVPVAGTPITGETQRKN